MTPKEVQAIRDQIGGTKAMAERLNVTDRAIRYFCQKGVKRRRLVRDIERLGELADS